MKNPAVTTMAMFGIWKAGAVFIPINFSYMGRLLSYQINDTDPRCLLLNKQCCRYINEIKDDLKNLIIVLHNPKEGEHDYNSEAAGVVA
jgi:crotonobetaine/carnitine-CoA ligase